MFLYLSSDSMSVGIRRGACGALNVCLLLSSSSNCFKYTYHLALDFGVLGFGSNGGIQIRIVDFLLHISFVSLRHCPQTNWLELAYR